MLNYISKLIERATYSRPRRRLADGEIAAWSAFLRAHAAITRRLERDLAQRGAITLSEYDVLAQLAIAGEAGLRGQRLAERVVLTKSGISRLVDRLVERGYVERQACPSDRRGYVAMLTATGRRALRAATPTHLAGVLEAFVDRLEPRELAAVGVAMTKLQVA